MPENIFTASEQWRARPPEQRYATLAAMHEAAYYKRTMSRKARLNPQQLRFRAIEGAVAITGAEQAVALNHWSMGQLADYCDAPVQWLRRVPAQLAADNLNYALEVGKPANLEMLWRTTSDPAGLGEIRCFTSNYGRVWDAEIIQFLREVSADETNGWKRPPAKTDSKYPSGYYLGDRNMFAFMVNETRRIDDGSDGGLARGFMVWNSEVKQMAFGGVGFLYKFVCGNHIVWGAQELFNIRISHLGQGAIGKIKGALAGNLQRYLDAGVATEEALIGSARRMAVGKTAVEAVKWLGQRKFTSDEAVEIVARAEQAGTDPTNLWALVNSATQWSQERFKWSDERAAFDRKVGKLLDLALG